MRIYYGCCDCVFKSVGLVRLRVRLGLLTALVREAAALDVRTNYAFKAVGRLNAAVGGLICGSIALAAGVCLPYIWAADLANHVRQAQAIVALLVLTPIPVCEFRTLQGRSCRSGFLDSIPKLNML